MVCFKHNQKFSVFIALISFIFLIFSCNADFGSLSRVTEETLDDGVLVMVYMAGANSLSNEIIIDLNKMEQGLYDATSVGKRNLHVVALCDQMSKEIESDTTGNVWNGTRLYEIKPDKNDILLWNTGEVFRSNINSNLIKTASSSLGTWRTSAEQEEDMGKIETLKNFVTWARETYPYCSMQMLILWDHGAGISSEYSWTEENAASESSRNVCSDDETVEVDGVVDESFDAVLYIDEIQQLLKEIYSADNKLEFLGFDACYMGLYEVAYEFRDCVKYMAASPATETGGWAYDYVFAQDDSLYSGKNFAINVVDGYYNSYPIYSNTMSAFDLSYMEEMKNAVDSFATKVGECILTSDEGLDNLRKSIENDAIFLSGKNYYKYFPYYELGSLLDFYSNNFGDDVKEQVSNVQSVMKKIIMKTWLCKSYGDKYEENSAYGMGIFNANRPNKAEAYTDYYGFYTDSLYNETDPQYTSDKTSVLGYGGIDAANVVNTTNGTIECWRELQNYIYAGGFY